MPKVKSAITRYHIIDTFLNNPRKPYPSLDALAQACSDKIREGISTSTIEKDIRQMKMDRPHGYAAPIEYSKRNNGYFYAEQGFSIADLQLSDKEWEGLRYAAHLLHQYAHVNIFRDFRQAIDKINTRFNLLIDLEEQDFNRYIQFETGTATTGYDWMGTIIPAITNRWLLQLDYENIYKNEIKSYLVQPVLLKEHRNRWYLIAWVSDRNDYLTFGLDRMQRIDTIEKKQKFRTDFNPDHFLQYSMGIMENDARPQKVVLQIEDPYHKLLQLEPLHHSQKTVQQNAKNIRVELLVHVNHELCNRILSMGPFCKVVQPANLKKQIKELLTQTIALY